MKKISTVGARQTKNLSCSESNPDSPVSAGSFPVRYSTLHHEAHFLQRGNVL
jgi:hypothetical protein